MMTIEPLVFSSLAIGFLAAAAPPAPAPASFEVNGFDVLVLILLVVGMFRGRKRGMSEELLPLMKWLTVIVVGGMYYEPLGTLLSKVAGLSLLACYFITYLTLAVLIAASFGAIKRMVGEKLIGSDLFGRMEYYFGMVAGMLRFACMILFALALLNAYQVSKEEIDAYEKKQLKELGSSFFPSPGQIQYAILHKSLTGPFVRKYMEDFIIKQTAVGIKAGPDKETPAKKRERATDAAVGSKVSGGTDAPAKK